MKPAKNSPFTSTLILFYYNNYRVFYRITPVNEFANNNASARQFGTTISLNYVGPGGDLPIQPKVLLNALTGYKISEAIEIYVNGQSILNTQTNEYRGTDDNGELYSAGVNLCF
jgi:hypothetical protein